MNEDINRRCEHCINSIVSVEKLIVKIPFENLSFSTMSQYCEEYSLNLDEEWFRSYMQREHTIKDIEYSKLFSNLEQCKNRLIMILESVQEWDSYNIQYRMHIDGTIDNAEKSIDKFISSLKINTNHIDIFLVHLYDELLQLSLCFENSADELYEHFKYGDKNYVVFGKNGSGKTTLLNKISTEILNKNSFVIPANRSVKYKLNHYITMNLSNTLNDKLADDNLSIFYLSFDIENKTIQEYDEGAVKEKVTKRRLIAIFDALGLDRRIRIKNKTVYLYSDNEDDEYSLETASDGERTVVYMIMATLLMPPNSFLFIDEPENHLNGALMRNLFDVLEAERRDVRFIYLTHNIDFIETRKNYELIYLEKTPQYMKWKFHCMQDFNDVPTDTVLNIEGTKNNVLFCEGDDKASIDFRILKALYPNIEVIPAASCEKVINSTKGLNGKEKAFRRKAFGVIDNDYRTIGEISKLNSDGIKVLAYNEWENLLLDSDVVNKLNNTLFRKNLTTIKEDMVKQIQDRKKIILSDFINKRFFRILYSSKFDYDDNISDKIDEVNKKNKERILKEVEEVSNQIDSFVAKTDYDSLVQIVSGKMFLGDLSKGLGCKDKADYVSKFIDLLYEDETFRNEVIRKINIDIL